MIAGLVSSTPVEAVLAEARLDTLSERGEAMAGIAMERSLRVEAKNPRAEVATRKVRPRLKKKGWREVAIKKIEECIGGEEDTRDVFPPPLPPWLRRVELEVDVLGEKSCDVERNLQLSLRKLRSNTDFDIVLFTDGSVAEGGVNGGAAAVVTRGGSEGLEVLWKIELPAGRICSSYHAELVAIREGLRWLIANQSVWKTARIVADSKSALESVARYQWDTNNGCLRDTFRCLAALEENGRKLVFTWVLSHCGLGGKEMADADKRRQPRVFSHHRSRRVYCDNGVGHAV